jgi:hypothetical protein
MSDWAELIGPIQCPLHDNFENQMELHWDNALVLHPEVPVSNLVGLRLSRDLSEKARKQYSRFKQCFTSD